MAYDTWMGATYLSGVAGEMGVSIEWVSVLTAIPALGAIVQLFSLWSYDRASSLKDYVVQLAAFSRAIWCIPVALAWYWGIQSYRHHSAFPATHWFFITAICSALSAASGSASGIAWMAWIQALIPRRVRGRFLGTRQRFTVAAVVLAHCLAVFVIGWKPHALNVGYALLLSLGVVSAAVSTVLLNRVRDVKVAPKRRSPSHSFQDLLSPLKDSRFRSVVLFGAIFNGAVQLAGPYFPYFFTHDLKLSMSTVSFWTVLSNLGWFVSSVYWGRHADSDRRLGRWFWACAVMIALSPAFYIFASAGWAIYIGPFDYFTNGVFWAGYTLVFTTVLLEVCPPQQCGLYYAVYAAVNGLAGASGTFIGAQLSLLLHAHGGMRSLWAVAMIARLGVIVFLHPLLIQSGQQTAARSRESHCAGQAQPVAS